MDTTRREFMKLFGMGVASLLLARCKPGEATETPQILQTCYLPTMPSATPTPTPTTAYGRLRLAWLSFGELARRSAGGGEGGDTENTFGRELIDGHRRSLDELVAGGELPPAVADLVQEAYDAAVFHVWRSNVPITCYIAIGPFYVPESAASLVQQSEVLAGLAGQGQIDPGTLVKAHAALEHDLAFYSLTDAEVQALYERLRQQGSYPSFEDVGLELTPEAKAAADFIIDLLINPGGKSEHIPS